MANRAAWIPAAKAQLTVSDAPYSSPGADEVVIKNAYVAINPVDWKIQETGAFIHTYPNVLGCDSAGEVVEVGSKVKYIQKGQRVLAHCISSLETDDPKHAAFQLYTVVPETVVATIPDSLSFDKACVLPLALSTAAAGLYGKGFLALPYPTKGAKSTGSTILIWGGSSSVGSAAIQLAAASGLIVAATASKKNHDYVKDLGATHVFDYAQSDVADEIAKVLEGSPCAGAYDAIAENDTTKSCAEVVHKLGGGTVATVGAPPRAGLAESDMSEEGIPNNVQAKAVYAVSVATQEKEIGHAIYRDFVPAALQDGRLKCKPEPMVIKGGLEKVQEALNVQRKGVSARKVVVEL